MTLSPACRLPHPLQEIRSRRNFRWGLRRGTAELWLSSDARQPQTSCESEAELARAGPGKRG